MATVDITGIWLETEGRSSPKMKGCSIELNISHVLGICEGSLQESDAVETRWQQERPLPDPLALVGRHADIDAEDQG
jgi:hypothetical protein